MNPSSPKETDLADKLLAAHPGRPITELFATVARLWYGEKEANGRAPIYRLGTLGRLLGLDEPTTNHAMTVARYNCERMRRIERHGKLRFSRTTHRRFRYVTAGNEVIEA